MSNTPDLKTVFGKFAGKEVQATEIVNQTKWGAISHVEVAANDPIIAEIKKEAAALGLKVRLWTPGIMGTMDYRTDRLNAHVEKDDNGKFVVSDRFNIG